MPSPVRYYEPAEFVGSPEYAEFLFRRDLACRDVDPTMFEVNGDERLMVNRRRIAAAKEVCAGCPARSECARFAIEDYTDSWMVRGGLTPNDRVELRRRARLAPSRAAPVHDAPDENLAHAFVQDRPPRWGELTHADRALLCRELRRRGYTCNAVALATHAGHSAVRRYWDRAA